jgi:hypothetical protein
VTRRRIVLVLLIAITALSQTVTSTTAAFTASVAPATSDLAIASMAAPTGLVATPVGDDVALSWASGSITGGDAVGHRMATAWLGIEPGVRDGRDVPAGCTDEGGLLPLTRVAGGTFTSTGAAWLVPGSWRCYGVRADYPAAPSPASWSSVTGNPVAAVQVGHVVRSVTLVDGGTPGRLRPGDAFVVTFNQPVATATGPVSTSGGWTTPAAGNDVCIHSSSDTIVVGRVASALGSACTSGGDAVVGRVTGAALSPNDQTSAYRATYAWAGCATASTCTELTVTLGTRYRGSDVSVSIGASASFAPTTDGGRLTTPGGTALCSASNTSWSTCRPTPTGGL